MSFATENGKHKIKSKNIMVWNLVEYAVNNNEQYKYLQWYVNKGWQNNLLKLLELQADLQENDDTQFMKYWRISDVNK